MRDIAPRTLLSVPTARKLTAAAISLMLILNASLLCSWAWLSSRSGPIVNTFVYGDLSLSLTETDTDTDGDPRTNIYEIKPGGIVAKDPKLTVTTENSGCWLFVKLQRSGVFDEFLEYDVADGWTDLNGTETVYYRMVAQNTGQQVFEVLSDNTVTVKDTVTKEAVSALTDGSYPTLTVTAYAVQEAAGLNTPEDAWNVFGEE